jgi:hypothetical protein
MASRSAATPIHSMVKDGNGMLWLTSGKQVRYLDFAAMAAAPLGELARVQVLGEPLEEAPTLISPGPSTALTFSLPNQLVRLQYSQTQQQAMISTNHLGTYKASPGTRFLSCPGVDWTLLVPPGNGTARLLWGIGLEDKGDTFTLAARPRQLAMDADGAQFHDLVTAYPIFDASWQ